MKQLSFLILPLAVAGCGGGSGGPGGPDGTSFLGLTDLKPGETVTVHGNGRTASTSGTGEDQKFALSITADGSGKITASTGDGSSVGITAPELESVLEMAVDQDISIDDIDIPDYDVSVDELEDGKFIVLETETDFGEARVAVATPAENGFEYQTFSTWASRIETSSGVNGMLGAANVGVKTAAADIPSSGTATFKGKAMGEYVSPDAVSLMTSDATLNANFANRSVSFTTANTRSQEGSRNDLNLNGTMSYSSGSNEMSGTVRTEGGMTGDVDGRFYGPNAQEAGGTFSVRGDGDERYLGGYGANKQ